MQRPASPWWRSIVFRTTAVFTGFVLAAVFITGYLVFEGTRASLETSMREDLHHALELAELRLKDFAGSLGEDIALLADNDPVRSLARASDAADTAGIRIAMERITFMLESFIRSRQHFAQTRFLDAEGMERIRFDRTDGGVVQVPDSLLQSKLEHDYFTAAMALQAGELYLSSVDLNKEHGRIAKPWMPTIRAAAPIRTLSGTSLGMVIINADLRTLFAELLELGGPRGTFMLASPDGQLLLHPDTARTFRFEYGGSHTLVDELGGPAPRPDSVFLRDGAFMLVHPLSMQPAGEGHQAAIRLGEHELLASLRAQRTRSQAVASAIAAVFVLLAMLYALSTRKRLARLTSHIESYAAGSTEVRLPMDREDELGTMARSLGHMQLRIDQRVAELEQARHAAEEADRRKQEFLANMSHEVRTPLNAILGMAETLSGSNLDPAQQEQLGILQRSAKRLRGLVDDLLLHARITEGRLPVKHVAVDLERLLADVAQAHLPTAMGKGIALRTQVSGLPGVVHTDPLRIHQVLDNLVTNALKFTERGHVDVLLDAVEREGPCLRITVSDTGPGIAPQEQARIFERFERGAASEKEHGAGLGLAITHRLVQLMQGSIGVESAPGMGSRFTVHLPLQDAGSTHAPAAMVVDAQALRGLRVLYVEDVPTNRQLMAHWAQVLGWELHLADGPAQALEACGAQRFDVLLVDLDLGPVMRGSELAMRIRGQARYRHVPILALTAYVDEAQELEALKAGMNERITKPMDRAELTEAVAFWTDHAFPPDMPEPDMRRLEAQYDNDAEAVIHALQRYRREFLEQRLALRNAIAAGHMEVMSSIRHKLKPHLVLLGMEAGVQWLDTLEATETALAAMRMERMFRMLERAFMRRQRELLATLLGGQQ